MSDICKTCDTRCRLGLCKGRDGDFRFCFRRIGTLTDLKDTITPFNTLHELYEKCDWLQEWFVPESLILDNQPYGRDNNMVLLWGQLKSKIGTDEERSAGYVTAVIAEGMKEISYKGECI
jgi:hypothetical protein